MTDYLNKHLQIPKRQINYIHEKLTKRARQITRDIRNYISL